jgi:hypothetical protein
MIRNIAALVAGVLAVGVVVLGLQWVGTRLHPLPEGLDPLDPEQQERFREYVRGLPASGWILAFLSELLGAFVGALVAGRIASSGGVWIAGAIVGIALAGSISNWSSFPHPTLFFVGQTVGYPLVFLLAATLLRDRSLPDTSA